MGPPINGTEERLDAILDELKALHKAVRKGRPDNTTTSRKAPQSRRSDGSELLKEPQMPHATTDQS